MKRMTRALLFTALLAAVGCSLRPTSYQSFGEWALGDPTEDYELIEIEGRNTWVVMLQGYLASPLFAARDGLRIALVPLVFPYYLVAGEEPDRYAD